MKKSINLNTNLKKLNDIADWFDEQDQVDVEEGLAKVKEAAVLIKESRERFTEIANEFKEIKKDIEGSVEIEAEEESTEEELF